MPMLRVASVRIITRVLQLRSTSPMSSAPAIRAIPMTMAVLLTRYAATPRMAVRSWGSGPTACITRNDRSMAMNIAETLKICCASCRWLPPQWTSTNWVQRPPTSTATTSASGGPQISKAAIIQTPPMSWTAMSRGKATMTERVSTETATARPQMTAVPR